MFYYIERRYLDNCPRGKLPPRLGLGFGSRLALVLGLGGGQPDNCPKENWPPVRVRVWVRVSFGVGGGNFPRWQLS